jgi:hypothetical protein
MIYAIHIVHVLAVYMHACECSQTYLYIFTYNLHVDLDLL